MLVVAIDLDPPLGERVDLLRDRHDVLVVGQHDHALRRGRLDRLEDLRGRRVHRLATGDDDLHTETRQQPTDTVAHTDRDDRGLDRRRQPPRSRRHRSRPSRARAPPARTDRSTRIWCGRPGLDPGLHCRADVVGVHVAVPDAFAADDDDRVAERSPRVLEGRDRRVGRVEEVHHLVAQARNVVTAQMRLDREWRLPDRGFGYRASVDDLEERREQQRESLAARVDDSGLAQHGQQVGSARDRGVGRVERVREQGDEVRFGQRLDRLGRLADDGEDRALDRPQHRLVGRVGRAPHRRGELRRPERRRAASTPRRRPAGSATGSRPSCLGRP